MTQKQKRRIWRIVDLTEVAIVLMVPVFLVLFTSGFFTPNKWVHASQEQSKQVMFTQEASAAIGARNLLNIARDSQAVLSDADRIAAEFLVNDDL